METQIRHRYTNAVLYTHATTAERQASGLATRDALEAACKCGANLDGANLAGANLTHANLAGANLAGANLTRANLTGAYLAGAYLTRANLAGANLTRAYLDGANLTRANLDGANLDDGVKLAGSRPVFQVGPIGSRCAYFTAYVTTAGPRLRAGCFFGTVDEFRKKLASTHGANVHGQEYEMALALIEKHAALWSAPEQQA